MRSSYWTVLAVSIIATVVVGACAAPRADSPAATNQPALPGSASSPLGPTSAALLPPEIPPAGAEREFSTDFARHTVPYGDILSGGPPKEGIPAIDRPQFVAVDEANAWLTPMEPVVLVQAGDETRAYPLQILMWHEIVNDTVGGLPLAVSFCPLCNTAIAFERTLDGRVLDFGTTGRLRFSNLIMYDRQTETWWQQASGEGLAGELAGQRLAFYPATIVPWAEFRDAYPAGKVLSRETGYDRDYGRNPYQGYDDVTRSPFLYEGPATPGALPAMARVFTVAIGGEAVAYPYDTLATAHVVEDTVGGTPVVIFWVPGTVSALDGFSVSDGQNVGSAAAFSPVLDGRRLTFRTEGAAIADDETGSQWNVLGQAVSGELAGRTLEPIVGINHFWFSWAAFRPDTRIYEP